MLVETTFFVGGSGDHMIQQFEDVILRPVEKQHKRAGRSNSYRGQ
jgi:hypothetical protein